MYGSKQLAQIINNISSLYMYPHNTNLVLSLPLQKPRRTYVHERPKRKRKQRVHVLFIETDSSDNEDNEQDSHDKSNESPRKAKRTRRDVEHEAKLNEFVTSFNQQCEEVEKFPLIIE